MFLMGWEDSQILWFLPSSLAFELRCIDLADVSTIVLLKQKHKTWRQKARSQRPKVGFVCTQRNVQFLPFPKDQCIWGYYVFMSYLIFKFNEAEIICANQPTRPSTQSLYYSYPQHGTRLRLKGTWWDSCLSDCNFKTNFWTYGVCCLFWKAITNSPRVACQLGSKREEVFKLQ